MWLALIVLGVISYFLYKRFLGNSGKYWEKYGIKQIDASSAATNWEVFMGKKDITERDEYAYNYLAATGAKFVGLVENSQKIVVVNDLEIIKKIFIKDFENFPERRDFFAWADENNVFRRMMSEVVGEDWKNLRHTLSPTFTTGKIRKMMDCFNIVGKEWVEDLKRQAASKGSVELDVIKNVNQYTVDVIAAAVFGMKAGSIKDPNSKFATMAYKFLNFNVYKMTLGVHLPWLTKLLGIEPFDMESTRWFEAILDQGLQERLNGGARKNDFLQLLVDARNGELKAAEEDELSQFEKDAQGHFKTGKKIRLTDDVLNAQSLLFFVAGFSTTSNFITFCLYALAAHQEVQEKLRKEVDAIDKGDGNLDYDELGSLQYMDMFINETLRMFVTAPRLERLCKKDYKDPDSGLTVPKGALVAIPVKSIHYDPQYYPNPKRFDPEGHFSPEKKQERSPYAFLPFGSGPRNCIGMRFALIESKAAVAHIVHNFLVEPTKSTPLPMRYDAGGLQLVPPHGLELKYTPRK